MSLITTHVLDTSIGKPAVGVPVILEYQFKVNEWRVLCHGVTDADGRVKDLVPIDTELSQGVYRLTFDTALYFTVQKKQSFYPEVSVTFFIDDTAQHFHVPLLLNPFGFTTYRGS